MKHYYANALFTGLLLFAALTASAQQKTWYLLGREEGCADLQALVEIGRLSRVPVSPEDFAQMMIDRGEKVEIGLPEGFSSEFAGKVVQVKYGNGKSPIFVQEEICRTIDKGK